MGMGRSWKGWRTTQQEQKELNRSDAWMEARKIRRLKRSFFLWKKKKSLIFFSFLGLFVLFQVFVFFILLILCVFIFNLTVLLFEYIFASVSKEAVEISSTVNCSAQQHRSWGHQQIENATVLNILTPAPRIWATVFKRKACSEEYSFIRKNSYFLSRCNLWQHHFCPQLSGGTFCTQI